MATQNGKRAVLITGGAQGIGRAFARRFADDGYQVAIADLNVEKGTAVAKALSDDGTKALFVRTDITDAHNCLDAVAAAAQTFGRLDVLINNAGIAYFQQTALWELDVAEWDRIMAVNVRGSWLMMKAAVPAMRVAGGGSIINMSSNTFLSGRTGFVHYVASKGAVVGLTRSAARELGELNIRVNCIMPGSTITDERRERGYDEHRARVLAESQSIKREEVPRDLVGVAAFLASEDARFMTGQSLNVDGGFVFL